MKNLHLISSPFQLLCSIESIYHFKIEDNELVVINNGSNKNYESIEGLLKLYNGIYNNVVTHKENDNSIIGWTKKFYYFNKLYNNIHFDKIFIGDYRDGLSAHISNIINSNSLYILDDGLATVTNKNNNINFYLSIKYIFKLLVSKFRYSKNITKDYKNFTIFSNFIKDSIGHNFNHIKNEKICKINKDEIYIIGSPVVEDGIIEKDEYLKLITRIVNKFIEKKIVYVEHRREEREKLVDLDNYKYLDIKNFGIPIEVYFLENGIKPINIASLYSTALITLSLIFDDLECFYIELPFDKIKKNKKEIKIVYKILDTKYKFTKIV